MTREESMNVQLEKLEAKAGDVVVARFPKGADRDEMNYTAAMLRRALPTEVTVLLVPDGYDLKMLPVEDMARLGWARAH